MSIEKDIHDVLEGTGTLQLDPSNPIVGHIQLDKPTKSDDLMPWERGEDHSGSPLTKDELQTYYKERDAGKFNRAPATPEELAADEEGRQRDLQVREERLKVMAENRKNRPT